MTGTQTSERSLRDYARVLLRRKWLIIIAVIVCVGGATAYSVTRPAVYEAEAEMLIRTGSSNTVFTNTNAVSSNDQDRILATEIKVLQSATIAQRVTKDLGLSSDPPFVTGSAISGTDVVSVTVRDADPAFAAKIANAYITAYIEVKREQSVNELVSAGTVLQQKVTEIQAQIDALDKQAVTAPATQQADIASQRQALVDQKSLFKQRLDQLQVDAELTTGGAQQVVQAIEPTKPVSPTPVRTGVLGLVAGLVIGCLAALVRDHFDDSIRSADDLEALVGDLPVLAVVPGASSPDGRPIAISRPRDFSVEIYRSLRTSLQFLGLESEARVIQITSSTSGEGKTTTVANLGVVFSQAGARVALVDADLRKPRLHQLFPLDQTCGLTTALLGESVEPMLTEMLPNLFVLPSGPVPPNPSEMLGGRQMRDVIETLAAAYDIVLIDSAPVLPVTDSVALSTLVQGVVVIAQAGRTRNAQVVDTLERLRRVQAPLLGIVLNRTRRKNDSDLSVYGYGNAYTTPARLLVDDNASSRRGRSGRDERGAAPSVPVDRSGRGRSARNGETSAQRAELVEVEAVEVESSNGASGRRRAGRDAPERT